MPHLNPDAIALRALGEPLSAADQEHLDGCAACAEQVDGLSATVAAGRAAVATSGTGVDLPGPAAARGDLVPAPPAIWDRISAELGLAPQIFPATPRGVTPAESAGNVTDPAPADLAPFVAPGPVPRPDSSDVPGIDDDGSTGTTADRRPTAPVPPTAARSRRWWLPAAAGLVVGAAIGGSVVAGLQRPASETVLAEARLDALPGWSASGDALLEEAPDGSMTLVVRVSATEEDGFRAVWLLDQDATRLVSLGALDGDEGRFAIPAGLDLTEFGVVDVSAEPFDGDPGHSGDSIVRGALGDV